MGAKRDRRRATRQARRTLGLTWGGVVDYLRTIKEEGELRCASMAEAKASAGRLAGQVLDKAFEKHPKVSFGENIDWDAIIEFLERLIPLILKIIGLFG